MRWSIERIPAGSKQHQPAGTAQNTDGNAEKSQNQMPRKKAHDKDDKGKNGNATASQKTLRR